MKKTLISLFVIGIITLFTAGAYAEWVLYDNFDSEEINLNKWDIDDSSADIFIEDGRLKIEHSAGNPNDSAWAKIIKNPHKWRGIKATMEVESWEGEARAGIGIDIGTLPENPDYLVWYEMRLRNVWTESLQDYVPAVSGYASVLDTNNFEWQYDIFYTNLGYNKQAIVGEPHKLIAKFNTNSIKFKVKEPVNLGQVMYEFTGKIDKIEDAWLAIGTKTATEDAYCVVYVDDVYVLR